jgi:predicted RecB family nuclease
MAYEHKSVIEAQYQRLNADRAEAVARYESGRISEDEYTTMDAANAILDLDQKRAALDRIAQNFVAGQQQPRGNQFGLSQDEVEIANGIAGSDKTINNEQRQQAYAANRDRLRHMRATGQYRDQQG